jgi:O-antigen/teichoic acid export membrane protein
MEEKTSKRLRHLTKQSLVYGLGPLLSKGISFLLVPIYTQYLTTAAYGVLSVASSLINILVSVLPLGLPAAGLRFYFETSVEEKKRVTVGTVWLTSLPSILGVPVLLLIVGPMIRPYAFPEMGIHHLRIAILIGCFEALRLLPLVFFRARENARRFVLFNVGTSFLIALFSILFVAGLRLGAMGALFSQLVVYVLTAGASTLLFLNYAKLRFQPNLALAGLKFGLPLVPSGVLGWILRLSDRLIMQQYLGMGDIGVYSLGYQLGNLVSMLGSAINSAWSPFYYRIFQEQNEEAPAIVAPIITYFVLVTTFVGLVVAVLSPEIIRILAQPSYHPAQVVVPWIALSSVIRVFNWITRQGINYAKKTYWEPVLNLLGGGVSVAINLFFLPRVGYIAAAWATVIGYSIIGILAFYVSQRVHPIIYEYRRLAILVFTAFGIFATSRIRSIDSIWLSIGIKAVLLCLYPLLLWFLGFASKQEREALCRLYVKGKKRLLSSNGGSHFE